MPLLQDARSFVADNIKPRFHDLRLASIEGLKLHDVLRRKNPYLFRAKAVTSAPEMVRQRLEAHLSSNEETLFGAFLEEMAIFVCERAHGGVKSSSEGIDLDFSRDGTRYLVSIKSGPNWGNSNQIRRMVDDFNRARRIVGSRTHVVCVNGCCYGRDARPEKKKGYLKLCGQDFWTLVSGEPLLYIELVEPLGHEARRRCDEFNEAFGRVLTRFTVDFARTYCDDDGALNWPRLLELNSGSKHPWNL